MKQELSILRLPLLFALILAISVSVEGQDCVDEQGLAKCYKVNSPLTIDGNLSEAEWCVSNSINIDVQGNSDNTAHFGVLWDDTYLYVGINVVDDVLFDDANGIHQNDGVEIYLDPNNEKAGEFQDDDGFFQQGWNRETFKVTGINWENVLNKVVDTQDGYSVEFAIPWANLTITPEENVLIGFTVGVNDDDDGGTRDAQQMWAGTADNWQNTSGYGEIQLRPAQAGVTYNVVATAGDHGSINPSGTTIVNENENLSLTITADEGYTVSDVLVDDISIGAVTSYEFINVISNHTISAAFKGILTCTDEQETTISYKVESPLTIDGNLAESEWCISNSVAIQVQGETDNTSHFGVLWDDTYLYIGVMVQDGDLFDDANGVHNNDGIEVYIDPNNAKTATFEEGDGYYQKGWNNEVLKASGLSTENVLHKSIDITGGYAIEMAIPWTNLGLTGADDLTIGFSLGVNDDDGTRDSQTMWAGTADNWQNTSGYGEIVLKAVARTVSYDIVASAGENGTIDPSGTVSVEENGSQTFMITPDFGYEIANVTVDGVSVGTVDSYSFDNVTENHTINANFLYAEEEGYPLPNPEQMYPTHVHLVKRVDAANIQAELDQHRIIRLEPGNYDVDLTISSGCEVYGWPDSQLRNVTVLPGTRKAVLSGVIVDQLIFPAGASVTKHNLFRTIECKELSVADAKLEENLFLNIEAKFNFDVSNEGYLRNNRIIRSKAHSVYPSITMIGDEAGNTFNNTFLWFNILTPHGDATKLESLKDFTMVSVDAETWNYNGIGASPLFNTENLGTFRLFGLGGGSHTQPSNYTGLMKLDAVEAQIYTVSTEEFLTNPNIEVTSRNEASYFFDIRDYSRTYPENSFQVEGFVENTNMKINEQIATASLIGENLDKFNKYLNPDREGQPWEKPTFEPIVLGENLVGDMNEDATATIQSMIDNDGIALLDSGVYYISAPLKIGKDQGIIGRGKGVTVIRALSDTIDMITGKYDNTRPDYIIAELTLEGGKNGFHHKLGQTDEYQISTGSYISHVGFYNLNGAGILIEFPDGMGATFDNNFIDNCYFVNCGVGMQQITEGQCVSKCSLVDKVTFYQSQFIDCGTGVDLLAIRADHKNAWINCKFENNDIDVNLINNINPLFANSVFTNQSGQAVIKSNYEGTLVVGCTFDVGSSVSNILPGGTSIEGTTFNGNAPMFASASKAYFYQSEINGADMTNFNDGILVNTKVTSNEDMNKKFAWVQSGNITVLHGEAPNPAPQLLYGAYWGTDLDAEAPTVPVDLVVDGISETSVDLSWSASTDNVAVTQYIIYKDGVKGLTVDAPETNVTITGLDEGTEYSFTVSAMDAIGNESAQSVSVNATTAAPLSISSLSNDADILLFPNPLSDNILNIQANLDETGVLRTSVFDTSGKKVYQRLDESVNGSNVYQIDLKDLPVGIFIIRITNDKDTWSGRIVKE